MFLRDRPAKYQQKTVVRAVCIYACLFVRYLTCCGSPHLVNPTLVTDYSTPGIADASVSIARYQVQTSLQISVI